MAIVLSGKETAKKVRERLTGEVSEYIEKFNRTPKLTVIIVGTDPASQVYVRNKKKGCEEIGMLSDIIEMPECTTEEELLSVISSLSKDDAVDGILVQLPLPKHIDEKKIINSIPPHKDVDCFHPENVGNLFNLSEAKFLPCTPAGVMEILKNYNIEIAGKNCVVIGRSNIVGKPMALLLLDKNGTVTVCHSKTKDLSSVTREADILVVAIGRAKFVTADMIKEGAVVIDVGMDRDEDGKLCGDVDYLSCFDKASAITPVPGGVGPMTITMLLSNTLSAAKGHVEGK